MTRPPIDPPGGSDRPIDELHRLETEVSPQFVAKLRRTIERRVLVRDLSVLTWELPKIVFSELLFICAQWAQESKDRGGRG